ncbi:MAG: helix-turn-helix domain-containing protein [Chloroflexi bacterium]|nr:helix-turn-helix domain-containing protein [Chloroflexota bacterium]
MGTEERLTVTVPEAARLLGIGRGLAYELARLGELPCLRFGRRLVIPRAALTEMLASAANKGPAPTVDEPASGGHSLRHGFPSDLDGGPTPRSGRELKTRKSTAGDATTA